MSDTQSGRDTNNYRIVTASSLEALEKTVNDIIAQAWEEDGSGYGQWEVQGEVGYDSKNYFQVLVRNRLINATASLSGNK